MFDIQVQEEEKAHVPFKSTKYDSSFCNSTIVSQRTASSKVFKVGHANDIMIQDSQRDKSGEPKDHCHSIEGEDDVNVSVAREESRDNGQVDEDQHGPNGIENHEVDLGRRVHIVGD